MGVEGVEVMFRWSGCSLRVPSSLQPVSLPAAAAASLVRGLSWDKLRPRKRLPLRMTHNQQRPSTSRSYPSTAGIRDESKGSSNRTPGTPDCMSGSLTSAEPLIPTESSKFPTMTVTERRRSAALTSTRATSQRTPFVLKGRSANSTSVQADSYALEMAPQPIRGGVTTTTTAFASPRSRTPAPFGEPSSKATGVSSTDAYGSRQRPTISAQAPTGRRSAAARVEGPELAWPT